MGSLTLKIAKNRYSYNDMKTKGTHSYESSRHSHDTAHTSTRQS